MSNPKYQWLYDEYDQLRTMSKEMPDFFDDKVEETVWDINPEMPDSQALGLKEDCENAGTEFRRLRDRFEALSEAFDHD
jgi:hypothetical protein